MIWNNWNNIKWLFSNYCCCCLVAQLCLTPCDFLDCSTPGLPLPHHLLEFAQVHVHCSDAVQLAHPLTPSSSALNLSQNQGLSQWVICLHQMTKILELQLQHHSFQWIFWVDLLAIWGTFRSPSAPQFEGIDFLASAFFMVQLSHPYMTTGKTITLAIPTFVGMVCWTFVCFSMHCLGLS